MNIGGDDLSTFEEEGCPDMTNCHVLSRVPEWVFTSFSDVMGGRSGEPTRKCVLLYYLCSISQAASLNDYFIIIFLAF
jgi:hypothetical protein